MKTVVRGLPITPNQALSEALRRTLSVEPPEELRRRVLARHARRRLRAPALAALFAAAVGAALFATLGREPADDLRAWQARSQSLESAWRSMADRDWLANDARAIPVLARLRSLDRRLSLAHEADSDARALSMLWRERSETLAELVEIRRQGGRAIRL